MKTIDQNRSTSFLANVSYSALSLAGPLLFAFIATPYLVRGLGTEGYGYYSIVLAIIGFGFTTGIGRVTAKYIPENLAFESNEALSRLLAAALMITIVAAVLESIILALASPFLITSVLDISGAAADELQLAIYFACLIGPAMMVSQIFQSALQGIHSFGWFAISTIAAAFLVSLGSIFLAVNGYDYSWILIWNLLVTTISGIGFFILVRSAMPSLRFAGGADREALKTVGRFCASIFVYQSITSVFYLFERAFVLRNFGADALTYYTLPLMLGIYLHGLVLSFSQVVIPRLNEKIKHQRDLLELYSASTKIAVSGSVFLAVMYFCVGGPFLALWLGPDFADRSYWILVIHGAAFALIAVSINCWILSEASHNSGINAFSSTVTSVIGILFVISLASGHQAEGVAAGRLVGALAVLPLIPVIEMKVFRSMQFWLWVGILIRIAVGVVATVWVSYFLMSRLPITWPAFVFEGFVFTAIFWLTLFLSNYFRKAELVRAFVGQAGDARY